MHFIQKPLSFHRKGINLFILVFENMLIGSLLPKKLNQLYAKETEKSFKFFRHLLVFLLHCLMLSKKPILQTEIISIAF